MAKRPSKKESTEMNALLRQSRGVTAEEVEESKTDMNALLRAARGLVAEPNDNERS